jgi:hypothetical protein
VFSSIAADAIVKNGPTIDITMASTTAIEKIR